VFNIRLAKDFVSAHGHDRLLSLALFSAVPDDVADAFRSEETSEPQNAYDFMRRRQETKGHNPTLVRWHAAIRLGSYASVETMPLCVSILPFVLRARPDGQLACSQMASIGALLNHIVRERAFGELNDEGIRNLEVRSIESIAL
jgi:DNA mismatch repair protein MSH5